MLPGSKLISFLRKLFGSKSTEQKEFAPTAPEIDYARDLDVSLDSVVESQNGEAQVVAREQSYTDLWLASLGAPKTAAKKNVLVKSGRKRSSKGSDANKSDQSFTDLWMQALAPPTSDTGAGLTSVTDRLEDGLEVKDGDYRVLFQVERPGLGSTYLVSHQVLNTEGDLVRRVAVMKRYKLSEERPANAQLTIQEKFEIECKRLEKVSHPQIARLLDFFIEGDYGFIVHQYLEGFALRKQIKQLGPLDEKTVLGLLLQMCDLVQELHYQSPPVVHIDLTPDSLQMWRGNTLKLIDLSVPQERRILDYEFEPKLSRFSAPEIAESKFSEQSNIYSMGATLFFLLTGRRPDPKGDLHPRAFQKRLSADFDAVIARCTAPDPADRYSSIAQIKNCPHLGRLFYSAK